MKKILITGGAGSLGQAFVKYLHNKYKVTVIDNNEWSVATMTNKYPDVQFILDDFANVNVNDYDILIHLAAYKHVNLGEVNVSSFIDNNIIKTKKLFENAFKARIDIIFVSTDKAVEPISLYGMTKSIGEYLCKEYDGYIARLGNIYNSSGSVIPIWEEAIKNNKPIPITSLAMERYIIHADDAVKQIMQQYKKGNKLIIPEINKPLKISEIVTTVLKKHGFNNISEYKPGVKIIGIRPGEKIKEKLRWDWE